MASTRIEGGPEPGAAIRVGTRDQIVAAATRGIHDRGLAGATTRAIAEEAGCAEGSIYRYFPDKHALFVECVKQRFPAFIEMVRSLPGVAGKGSVRHHLETVTKAALAFFRSILPMVAGAMSQPELLEQQRLHFVETKTGPSKLLSGVADYVRAEQRLGRISDRLPAEHVARMVLGAAWYQAYLDVYLGTPSMPGADDQIAKGLAKVLIEGLTPRESARKDPPA